MGGAKDDRERERGRRTTAHRAGVAGGRGRGSSSWPGSAAARRRFDSAVGTALRLFPRRRSSGRGGRAACIGFYRGVYAVGHTDLSRAGECLAAVLAVGPGALLSYYSAGWLWGIWRGSPEPLRGHRLRAAAPSRRRAESSRHRARNLVDDDRAIVDGIPVTSVARTLLDLAWKLPRRPASPRCSPGRRARTPRPRRDRGGGRSQPRPPRREAPPLRARDIYRTADLRPLRVRAALRRPPRRAQACRGPPPAGTRSATSSTSTGPSCRFGVELDTYETHGTRDAFESDHDRDLALTLAGIETIRVSERQFRLRTGVTPTSRMPAARAI